jgi:serine protease AprX
MEVVQMLDSHIRKSVNWGGKVKRLNLVVVMALVLSLLMPLAAPLVPQGTRVQPLLLELAAQDPDQTVSVIVQKSVKDDRVEQAVSALGAKVTKDLDIINAFAAEVKAKDVAQLAKADGVRWVSLDAPTQSTQATDTHVFTSWATQIGTQVASAFHNSPLLVDSTLGPNGTYAYHSQGRVSVGGFAAEVTPGHAITKVEIVLRAYVQYALGDNDVTQLTVWADSIPGSTVFLSPRAYDMHIGIANAGPVIIDVTATRAWKWSDFEKPLEVQLDQYSFVFGAQHRVYHDALGLRVTSAPGTDTIADAGGDASALTTVNTSQQVNVYNPVIRSSDLWNTSKKLQGKGVTIAVVDSGAFETSDMDKRVRANANFNAAFHDAADRYGHGTFVAGIIAGNGAKSGGKYIGVAPRADVLNVRVSDDQGMSVESDVVNALQWVLDNKARYNIRVVNLSFNSSVAQSYHTSPLSAACEILWFNGIVVVVAAGNNGTTTLYPPANDPFVITVGATDDRGTLSTTDDVVTTFSAYGTTESGFTKPDLVAPGKNIIGLLPENDKLNMSKNRAANRVDSTYFKMSGTSVSAPMVSGAVALLLQDEPNLTPDQVKYRLTATANKAWPGYSATTSGAGYLDVYAAVNGTTTQSANTGITASQLLWTGDNPVNWGSVQWGSVQWGSVQWGSVQWGSVQWGSVQWGSDYWGP